MDLRDHVVNQDQGDLLETPEQQVQLALMDRLEQQDQKELKVIPVTQDHWVQLASQVLPALRV